MIIFLARVADVSLGTLRTMTVVRGRRRVAFLLGFAEVLIWVFAVSRVIDNLQNPVVAVSYALGFATGSVVGMTIERWLVMGQRVIRVFSTRGGEIAHQVREAGFKASVFSGESASKTETCLVYVEVKKRRTQEILDIIQALDPACFYIVEDVRTSGTPLSTNVPRTGWLATMMRK